MYKSILLLQVKSNLKYNHIINLYLPLMLSSGRVIPNDKKASQSQICLLIPQSYVCLLIPRQLFKKYIIGKRFHILIYSNSRFLKVSFNLWNLYRLIQVRSFYLKMKRLTATNVFLIKNKIKKQLVIDKKVLVVQDTLKKEEKCFLLEQGNQAGKDKKIFQRIKKYAQQ